MKKIFQKIRSSITQKWHQDINEKTMPFTEHLEELRYRLIVIFVTIGCCFVALYPVSEQLLVILRAPMKEQLYMLAPTEAFVVYLKLSLFGAIAVSIPMILYQGWVFVVPGLYANERKYILSFVVLGTIFFAIGGYFCYKVILPFGLQFLLGYGGTLIQPVISVSKYVSFVTMMILVFGVIFELPLIVVFLTKLGLVSPGLMKKYRKHAIVAAFVVGAILTPPDVFSQMLLAIPLLILYEISLWACVLFWKKSPED